MLCITLQTFMLVLLLNFPQWANKHRAVISKGLRPTAQDQKRCSNVNIVFMCNKWKQCRCSSVIYREPAKWEQFSQTAPYEEEHPKNTLMYTSIAIRKGEKAWHSFKD